MLATVAVVSLVVVVVGVLLFMYSRSEHFQPLPEPKKTHMLSENVQKCIAGERQACVTINTRQYGSTHEDAKMGYEKCKSKVATTLQTCKNVTKINPNMWANFVCAGQALSGSLARM
jgi:hypothetical protein